jgi:transcriptional regulator with XRE-family HTH domain
MTQLTLARKAKMNVARISFFENGLDEPDKDERKTLARVLGAPVVDVFPEHEAMAS